MKNRGINKDSISVIILILSLEESAEMRYRTAEYDLGKNPDCREKISKQYTIIFKNPVEKG